MNYKENHTSIPQYVLKQFHMQRFNSIDIMVIELRFFKNNNNNNKKKKKKMENMAKM